MIVQDIYDYNKKPSPGMDGGSGNHIFFRMDQLPEELNP